MSDETKHSPEPWRAADWSIRDAGGRVVVALRRRERDSARRIVAAVNAVAGIPTEALEAGALAKALDLLMEHSIDRDLACPQCHGCLGDHEDGCELYATLLALGRLP